MVTAGVVLLAVGLLVAPRVEREIAPEPVAAFVAVEIADSGLAQIGPIEIEAGAPFTLHAVIEARTWSNEAIYYTEAARLEMYGIEVPLESLRVWRRTEEPRILWFTVEGYAPYLEITEPAQLDEFHFEEHFRPDWPRSWTIPGSVQSRAERALRHAPLGDVPPFGTQRYHVRFELFGADSEIVPRLRLASLGASDLPHRVDQFTTVKASLSENLRTPSRVFGLSHLEPTPEILGEVASRLTECSQSLLCFSQVTVLRDLLDATGVTYENLPWQSIDLAAGPEWSFEEVRGGDLLRVGDRWVVLLDDAGVNGKLDRDDLCLDFDRGARIRKIGDVFVGEGLVAWAQLGERED